MKTGWEFYQFSHSDFSYILQPRPSQKLLSGGFWFILEWWFNNFDMQN